MSRSPLVTALILALLPVAAAAGPATPRPAASAAPHRPAAPAFRNGAAHAPGARRVPGSACSARAAAPPGSTGTLGPNGASTSQTLLAVPIGGGTSAETRRRIDEACARRR